MKTTLELLDAALAKTGMTGRALSLHLGHSQWTINRARERGSVSPVIAGQLAELLGLNVQHWMAIAVVETEPKSRVTDHLRRVLHAMAYKLTRLSRASTRRAHA